jgi:hypothetical protein
MLVFGSIQRTARCHPPLHINERSAGCPRKLPGSHARRRCGVGVMAKAVGPTPLIAVLLPLSAHCLPLTDQPELHEVCELQLWLGGSICAVAACAVSVVKRAGRALVASRNMCGRATGGTGFSGAKHATRLYAVIRLEPTERIKWARRRLAPIAAGGGRRRHLTNFGWDGNFSQEVSIVVPCLLATSVGWVKGGWVGRWRI